MGACVTCVSFFVWGGISKHGPNGFPFGLPFKKPPKRGSLKKSHPPVRLSIFRDTPFLAALKGARPPPFWGRNLKTKRQPFHTWGLFLGGGSQTALLLAFPLRKTHTGAPLPSFRADLRAPRPRAPIRTARPRLGRAGSRGPLPTKLAAKLRAAEDPVSDGVQYPQATTPRINPGTIPCICPVKLRERERVPLELRGKKQSSSANGSLGGS